MNRRNAKRSRKSRLSICSQFFPPTSTDYVRRFATEEALLEKDAITGMGGAASASSGSKASNGAANNNASESESSMSDFSDDEAHDMEL